MGRDPAIHLAATAYRARSRPAGGGSTTRRAGGERNCPQCSRILAGSRCPRRRCRWRGVCTSWPSKRTRAPRTTPRRSSPAASPSSSSSSFPPWPSWSGARSRARASPFVARLSAIQVARIAGAKRITVSGNTTESQANTPLEGDTRATGRATAVVDTRSRAVAAGERPLGHAALLTVRVAAAAAAHHAPARTHTTVTPAAGGGRDQRDDSDEPDDKAGESAALPCASQASHSNKLSRALSTPRRRSADGRPHDS